MAPLRGASLQIITTLAVLLCIASPGFAQAWPPRADEGFAASLYPSKQSAAAAAGERAVELVRELDTADAAPIRIDGSDDPAVAAVRRSLAAAFPARVGTGPADGDAVRVDVNTTADAVQVVVKRGDQGSAADARFVDQPWVEQAGEALDGRLVVHADRPGVTAEEAGQIALDRAAVALVAVLERDLAAKGHRSVDRASVRERVRAALSRGGLIADRFTARFDRPYGSVWHAAVLVDAAPESLAVILSDAEGAHRAATARTIRASAVSAGFVAVLILGYLVANAVTRGYFTSRLRFATMVLAVAGVWIVTRLV